MNKSDNN